MDVEEAVFVEYANASTSSLSIPLGATDLDDFLVPDFSLGKCANIQVKRTVCYIVAGLLLKGPPDATEILLVQESKPECHGKWYLPAGRMESGETIHEGLKREVKEESGLDCEPKELLSIEVQGSGWYRFAFFCEETGGHLKTENEADTESLSAKWFLVNDVLGKKMKLRSKDMLELVVYGFSYYQRSLEDKTPSFIMPQVYDQVSPGMFIRMLVVQKKWNNGFDVLLSKDTAGSGKNSLPLVEFSLNSMLPAVVSKFYRELLKNGSGILHIPSVCLSLQCLAKPSSACHDGLCLTLLVLVKPRMKPEVTRPDRYCWTPVENEQMRNYLQHMLGYGPKFRML